VKVNGTYPVLQTNDDDYKVAPAVPEAAPKQLFIPE